MSINVSQQQEKQNAVCKNPRSVISISETVLDVIMDAGIGRIKALMTASGRRAPFITRATLSLNPFFCGEMRAHCCEDGWARANEHENHHLWTLETSKESLGGRPFRQE
ncbi:hypothetical protein EVAR_41314_1 [Eumeta japonica]|uniref:Uncharacterized protein n=1 Tax=Eumeta variegata TaxID=151549 RepID=A0A4C1X167_EUMVA|nr:hypothetical protein EVAR_41314_1 [Eumeta japonica]